MKHSSERPSTAKGGVPAKDRYETPLVSRYATREMAELFGARHRARVWRELWLALAKAQRALGLNISDRQIKALSRTIDRIDFERAAAHEERLRHDVMAHLHAWADEAPSARGVLHLGATSAYVVDNGDLIVMREALSRTAAWLANVIDALGGFAKKHRARATLGLTHLQPAQLTTVGKRAALWCYDFARDLAEVGCLRDGLRFRGVKGTTGTQASFLQLFGGDHGRVSRLELDVARRMGFDAVEPITGQSYSRKVDAQVLCVLGGIAASVHKFANDMRLLASRDELEEPCEPGQVGSSAMPHKQNPMLCERATALSRLVMGWVPVGFATAAEQWFERTLDDSACKRVCLPEAFLATDGMLRIVTHVCRGIVVHPRVIEAHVREELPFLATEHVLMAVCAAGADRQQMHERLMRHAREAASRIKTEGVNNDLLERLAQDEAFAKVDFNEELDVRRFVGRAPEQVDEFLRDYVQPVRRRYRKQLSMATDLTV